MTDKIDGPGVDPVAWALWMQGEAAPRQLFLTLLASKRAEDRWPSAYKGCRHVPLYLAAPSAPAVPMKDHEKRELVDELTAIAKQYGQMQQLRARIAHCILPVLSAHCAECGKHASDGGEPLVDIYPLTDSVIDKVLSTNIPGGSSARDWFIPHETKSGLDNVRDVVRRMILAAPQRQIEDKEK